jgi:ribosomal protein S18 acetylase RimI-like enzyme
MPGARVTAGMPSKAAVFYSGTPVFETGEGFKGTVLARYPETESPLASGFLQGEKLIQGKAAALDVEHGDGHIILLGLRPQWRGQSFGSFRLLFNAAVFGAGR